MVRVEKLIIECLSIALILLTSFTNGIVLAQNQGPRTDDLVINFYADIGAAYNALKADAIDMVGYEITPTQYADAVTDPSIVVGPVGDRGKYEWDINNNYTATDLNDGRRNPCNYLNFRRGIAYLVDKDYVVQECCEGFADRIDQPLPYASRGWRNQSYWYEDGTYPYEFNRVAAAAAFDAAGFVQGTDPNPDYNASIAGSAEFLRIHPEKGTTMNLLEVCIRDDDARRLGAGGSLCDELGLLGIPTNQYEADSIVHYPKVFDNFDYHLYTGGWSYSRFPALNAYNLYHSSQYLLGGSNCISGNASDSTPMYPILDGYLYQARFPDNYSQAHSGAKLAFGYIVDQCITIELFSAKSYWAWSADLLGVVNAECSGLENGYSFMNAFKESGEAIRYGLKTPPNAMNKFMSVWYYDYQCLNRMDLYSGIDVPPYDSSVDQAGYILNWTTSTYIDPDDSLEKTVVTQTYRDNTWFVEPETGNLLDQVNTSHIYASFWMHMYASARAWVSCPCQSDIKTVRIKDSQTIEFYWDEKNYWDTYLAGCSILSFNLLSKGTITKVLSETLTADVGTGFLSCDEPIFVLSADSNGTSLIMGVDYGIYRTSSSNCPCGDVRIVNETYLGANINITYLAIDDPSGYYPGGLSWQDAFEGAGIYYATDFTPGVGGSLTLERNPYYYMETPPLGEIDFSKKPNGCYKINIFDVVTAATAYGSQGVSEPDFDWFAGADLAPPGGQIDIFDIVTITSNYGTVWDCHQ